MMGSCSKIDGSGEETGLDIGYGYGSGCYHFFQAQLVLLAHCLSSSCKWLAKSAQADCTAYLLDVPSCFTAFSQELCVVSLPIVASWHSSTILASQFIQALFSTRFSHNDNNVLLLFLLLFLGFYRGVTGTCLLRKSY